MGAMSHQANTPGLGARKEDSLKAPRDSELMAAARARAFTRLHERRLAEREQSQGSEPPNRRQSLSCALHGVGLIAAWTMLGRSIFAERGGVDDPRDGGKAPTSPVILRQPHMLAWESVLFQGGQYALSAICNYLKLPVGNATLQGGELPKSVVVSVVERFERDPPLSAKLYASVAWLAPLSEESLFRVVPHALLSRDGMRWEVGLPFNVAFAGIHNLVDAHQGTKRAVELSETVKLSLDTFPLSQFMLGAFCWYVTRRYGELAPILAHSLNNHVPAFALIYGGRGILAEFNSLLAEELEREVGHRRDSGRASKSD